MPKIEKLEKERDNVNNLYQECKKELNEWQNKNGLAMSSIEEIDKLKSENQQLIETKKRLEDKVNPYLPT